jgi:outer membrane protein
MIRRIFLICVPFLAAPICFAQASAELHVMPGIRAQSPAQTAASPTTAAAAQDLTLEEAEKMAIANHPRVQASAYLAAAAKAQVTEAKSEYYPHAYGSATGVMAENDSRVTAGALNNPVIYNRFADGVTVDQLVTDFGRTHELVKSSKLHAQAQEENVVTSRADVLLGVDAAYYDALKAQAVLQVATETVKTRQLVSDQVTALEQNKLRSGLDVTFANVNLEQAKLLLVQAQNDLQASFAELSAALGLTDQRTFHLIEQPQPPAPPMDLQGLVAQALHNRPEIISQGLDVNAAKSYATAERDLWLPTISATGVAGLTPFREDTLAPRYAAGGFNVNIPIFNGRQFNALHAEANAQANAQQQYLRDLEDSVVRDVRKAWLNANSGYQRLALTQQLLDQANQSLDLAQQRYKLGLSSIIELSQAQLNQTQAQIEQASAKYDYEAELSTLNFQIGALQ